VWEGRAFPVGVSRKTGKQGIVELCGVGSAETKKSPQNLYFVNNCACNVIDNICCCNKYVTNQFSYRNAKTENNLRYFCYTGQLDNKGCIFKIDTGSDVSIVNGNLIPFNKVKYKINNYSLRYPTGEKVIIKEKVFVKVRLGEYLVEIPMLVAEINDDCILGVDFLRKIHLENIFETIFSKQKEIQCGHLESIFEVPSNLENLFKESSKNLNESQKQLCAEFINEFCDIFSEEIIAGNCKIGEHVINLQDSSPIKQVPRRIPIHMRKEVNKIIMDMRNQGVIEESKSPWMSPAVLVKKKDGTIRFCIDYRKLNAVTKKDSYPLPRIDDIFDQLAGNSWYSTLDLKSGYWQVKIRSEDKEKTAFSVGNGLWQFKVMPFGLCNAPATFERIMERVLQEYNSKICLVYLDDVIIFGKTFEEMIQNLKKVLSRLREVNLKVNPKKCILFSQKVKYLGHIISSEGISTDSEKINAVNNWPIPKNKKHLRSFLGLCSYYRKFVKGFSILAKPLYVLTENQTKFIWNKQCEDVFNRLKQAPTSSPILSLPKEEGELILDTDASNFGIGAVLSQKQDGVEKVISYFSRVLSRAEKNYCVTRRELLSIIESIKTFHHYLYGRKFLVRTDHASLKWLLSFKDVEGQLARWMEKLQQYEFKIIYRKGKLHANADGLSRRPCAEDQCRYCARVEIKEAQKQEKLVARMVLAENNLIDWRQEQLQDSEISIFLQGKEIGERPIWQEITSKGTAAKVYWSYWDSLEVQNGVLYKRWETPNLKNTVVQLIVPKIRIKQILEEAHDSPSGGHFGINKTLEKIRKRFYWATCKQDVEEWCKSCKICLAKRGPTGKGKSPLQIYNVGAPFERIQMDILGPLPLTILGNKYLLVVVDCFTKWVEAFPLKNIRARTVAEVFLSQIVSRHGVPLEIHTDQGRNFESQVFRELSCALGIKKTRTSALHPQSDGQVERQHQTILNYLAKFISENQRDWDRWIPMYLLAYRSSKHETTGVTPAELYFARDLRLPIDLLRGNPPGERESERTIDYISRIRKKLEDLHEAVRKRIDIKSSQTKTWYDQKARNIQFNVGQKVWFYNPRRKKGRAPKLQSSWEGPYFIIKKLNDVVYCICRSNRSKKKVVHADRLASFIERKE